jgi:hypothetical protein
MTTKLSDVIRFVIISPETLSVLASIAAWAFYPSAFTALGGAITEREAIATHTLISAPVGLTGLALTLTWQILFPGARNRALVDWPDYPKLKARVIFGLLLLLAGLILSLSVFVFSNHLRPDLVGLGMLVVLAVGLVVVGSFALAAISIREILETLDDSSDKAG